MRVPRPSRNSVGLWCTTISGLSGVGSMLHLPFIYADVRTLKKHWYDVIAFGRTGPRRLHALRTERLAVLGWWKQ